MKIRTQSSHIDSYKKYIALKDATNDFLKKQKYLELDLPVLSPTLVPESYLEVFKTEYRYLGEQKDLFLTPSPELFIKRLLAENIGDCYYLGKSFRNAERASEKHSSEFTMLEFYKVNADYMDIAGETLKLLQHLAKNMTGTTTIEYQNNKVSMEQWEKLSVDEAFVKYAKIKSGDVFSDKSLRSAAKKKGYVVDGFTYEDIFSQLYVQEVEPQLGTNGHPTLLYDYPKEFAALAKLNDNGITAQRFEFYIAGVELGDCYTELTNPDEQKARFEDEDNKRNAAKLISHPIDWGFVDALKKGLSNCSGIAIGFDRLAMIFVNVSSIHDLKILEVW